MTQVFPVPFIPTLLTGWLFLHAFQAHHVLFSTIVVRLQHQALLNDIRLVSAIL